jgi:hypothetical protein
LPPEVDCIQPPNGAEVAMALLQEAVGKIPFHANEPVYNWRAFMGLVDEKALDY